MSFFSTLQVFQTIDSGLSWGVVRHMLLAIQYNLTRIHSVNRGWWSERSNQPHNEQH